MYQTSEASRRASSLRRKSFKAGIRLSETNEKSAITPQDNSALRVAGPVQLVDVDGNPIRE